MRVMWTAAAVAAFVVALTGFPPGAYARSAAAPSGQDRNYLVAAHQFNLARIDSGQLARLKGMSASVRDLASKIVTDHLALDEALIPVAAKAGVSLPVLATDAQQATQSDLAAMAAGTEFDRQWTAVELGAHKTAISQNDAEINRGSDPAVVKLAQDAATVLALHHTRLMTASAAASPPSHVDSGSGGLADPRRTLIPLAITGAGLLLILAGVTLRRRPVR